MAESDNNEKVKDTENLIYVGFWKRFLAGIIDLIIILTLVRIIEIGFRINNTESHLLPLLIFAIYEITMNTLKGATLGKMLFKIKIIYDDESELSLKSSIYRFLSKLLSFITFGIGFIILLFDKKKRTLHDRISKTLVVKK